MRHLYSDCKELTISTTIQRNKRVNIEIIPAYIGPGAGLGSVGALAALVGAAFLNCRRILVVSGEAHYPPLEIPAGQARKRRRNDAG